MGKDQQPVDFRLRVTSEAIANNARSQIAFLTDTHPRSVRSDRIEYLYKSRDDYALIEYLQGRVGEVPPSREIHEKAQSLRQYAETLLGTEVIYPSYGMHAPSYLSGLEEYKRLHSQETHSSLLVGALTPSTVTEFAVVTRHVFPAADLHMLDIEGVTTRNACEASNVTFHKGNGLSMPFTSETFDTVQADLLLDYLQAEDHANTNYPAKIKKFFQEAYHVLKPGGMMLLVEHSLPKNFANFLRDRAMLSSLSDLDHLKALQIQGIVNGIANSGFQDITVSPVVMFRSRRYLEEDILLGNVWEMPARSLGATTEQIFIQAIK